MKIIGTDRQGNTREVEGRDVAVAAFVERHRDPTGAASGFEQRCPAIRKEALDEQPLRLPQAELVRGLRVVDDRGDVVEIGANLFGGDFLHHG